MEQDLRNQIAKEIEDACENGFAWSCGLSGNYQCSCAEAAKIVRGK